MMASTVGNEDRGVLLIEPRTRYSQNPIDIVELVFTPIAAVVIMYLLVINWSDLRDESLPMLVIGIALWMIAVLTVAFLVHRYGTYRPFRVYSRGFTSPDVPFPYGLNGRDVFVPFDSVERVEKHHLAVSGRRGSMLVVTYRDGPGTGRARILFMDAQDATGKVIDTFEDNVPDGIQEAPLLVDD
jgi:hypothetical protein